MNSWKAARIQVNKCCNKMRAGRPRSGNNYVSGIAACNSTCDGYVLDNCTAGNGGDGW